MTAGIPQPGHSSTEVRFSRVYVRFAPKNKRNGQALRISGNNPQQTEPQFPIFANLTSQTAGLTCLRQRYFGSIEGMLLTININ